MELSRTAWLSAQRTLPGSLNVPELMQIFRQTADVRQRQCSTCRAKLEEEKPVIRNAPASPELKEFVEVWPNEPKRWRRTGGIGSRVVIGPAVLQKITTEGRQAALGLRFDETGSLPGWSRKAREISQWKSIHRRDSGCHREPSRLTQLVFCDRYPRHAGQRASPFIAFAADKLRQLGVSEGIRLRPKTTMPDNAELALIPATMRRGQECRVPSSAARRKWVRRRDVRERCQSRSTVSTYRGDRRTDGTTGSRILRQGKLKLSVPDLPLRH